MFGNRLANTNAGGGGCTNTVDLYNPFPDGGGVALYQLNGDATDVSRNYDGTASNVTYGAGQFGQAAQFNGSNSYVLIADSPALRLTGDYTISFWFKTNSIGAIQRLVNKDNANDFSGGWALVLEPDSSITWVHNNGSTNQNWNTGVSITANTWYYVTAVYSDSNNLRSFYLNGSLQNTITTNTNVASETDVLLFGAYGQSSPLGQYFNGSLDQVRIFNRALRPYEVEALYTEEYCTPTIVPSEHFNTVTYTGTGTNQQVTGIGFEPDFVWIKSRTTTNPHVLHDTVRGIGNVLYSNLTNAEADESLYFTGVGDGFLQFGVNAGNYNNTGTDYVAWNFKAGGAAVTNNDGSITSQVSANTEAGFSIVTHGGPTGEFSVGHGLGTMPSIIITKGILAAGDWTVYFTFLDGSLDFMRLNQTSAKEDSSRTMWTDEVFYTTTENAVAYCFAEVEGFSSFGLYTGTGASGNTIITGFEPAFVMIKRTDAAASWYMIDNKRSPENVRDTVLFANLNNVEQQGQGAYYYPMNFLENGFELTQAVSDGYNANGGKYIYMAFAADPTTIEPTLEDSFNTVLYTGNGGTQSVTGVGFQPDLVWIKNRDYTANHAIYDSVRGVNKRLVPSGTNAEIINTSFPSFDNNGFTLATNDTSSNNSSYNYVAWNWKGAELPAINSNGSITSVVSANPAAGFSIVKYTGTSTASTVGHGLNNQPKIIIYKSIDAAGSWRTKSTLFGVDSYLSLNISDALNLDYGVFWNSTVPTESVFTSGNAFVGNYIAYCFAEVAGFSKFGSYSGGTSAIDLGFAPSFIMIKRTNSTSDWYMLDITRDGDNNLNTFLYANLSNAENTSGSTGVTVSGNTILPYGSLTTSGVTFIYMAFANQF